MVEATKGQYNPQEQTYFNIIPLGGTGVGKSKLASILLEGNNSSYFKSSMTTDGGETKDINFGTGKALGELAPIKIFDLPGLGDPDIPIEEWLEQIKTNLNGRDVDMALVVLKSTDFRIELPQILSFRIIERFLVGLEPQNIFIVFTRCDEHDPDDEFIADKLRSFKKYGKFSIEPSNVVKFYGNANGLEEFVKKFIKANVVFNPDDAQLELVVNDMPKILQEVKQDDPNQGKSLLQQLDLLYDLIRVKDYIKKLDDERTQGEKQRQQMELERNNISKNLSDLKDEIYKSNEKIEDLNKCHSNIETQMKSELDQKDKQLQELNTKIQNQQKCSIL